MSWLGPVLKGANNFLQSPAGRVVLGAGGGIAGRSAQAAAGRSTSTGSGTSTNIFAPGGIDIYNRLQPQGVGVLEDYMRDPFTAGYFGRQQQRLNETIGQQGRTAEAGLMSQLGQMGPVGVNNMSPFLASELGRINRSTQRSQATGLTDLLGQSEQLRRGAAQEALNYHPLQTGTNTSYDHRTEGGVPPIWASLLTGGLAGLPDNRRSGAGSLIGTAASALSPFLGGGGSAVAPGAIASQLGGIAAGTHGALTGTGIASGLAGGLGGGTGVLGAGTGAYGTMAIPGLIDPALATVGTGAAGAGAGGGGALGLLGGLASNPLTWIGAGGLAAGLLAKHYVGRGRRTADAIVPTQQAADARIKELTDQLWQQHAAGGDFGAQNVQDYLNQIQEVGQGYNQYLDQGHHGPNDRRALEQGRGDINRLVGQLTNDTRNAFLPYFPDLAG